MDDQANTADHPTDRESYLSDCIHNATEIAEHLLMEAPLYDSKSRIVPAGALLRMVQELNAAQAHLDQNGTEK